MMKVLLKTFLAVIIFSGCTSTAHNNNSMLPAAVTDTAAVPEIITSQQPLSLMDLPQTQYGGFVLSPGFYEAEFKTYCLQPGTPDPRSGDAYLQDDIGGKYKDIVQTALINSREHTEIPQRHIQLLLWSVVSGSDYNKLSPAVRSDAAKLLTPKQIFKLKGGVVGVVKTISGNTGLLSSNSDIQKLFDMGIASYESVEKIAVLKEAAQIKKQGVKFDQWYQRPEKYFVRYFPLSYQKVRIQVYVPDNLLDSAGTINGEHLVFDPTGKQAVPAFTNAQRLGIGAPALDVLRKIIRVSERNPGPAKLPPVSKQPAPSPKQS